MGWLTLLHHVLIIIAFLFGLYFEIGTFYMNCLLVNEGSTLFLNMNYLLNFTHYKYKNIYKYNGICLFITFLFFRILFNFYIVYHLIYKTWKPLFYLTKQGQTPDGTIQIATILTSLAFIHVFINLVTKI
jgi:hypothetical protein